MYDLPAWQRLNTFAEFEEPGLAVISSELAAELYGVKSSEKLILTIRLGNTTRFLVFARQQKMPL